MSGNNHVVRGPGGLPRLVASRQRRGLLRAFTRPEWFAHAACRDRTSWFYPPLDERPEARERRERSAGAICARCPVVDTCRSWARSHDELGFWGGENELARARARRLRSPSADAPVSGGAAGSGASSRS